jgi:hypothetical protein
MLPVHVVRMQLYLSGLMFVVHCLMLQITTAVEEANAALTELRVEHKEDLVVPFRIP